MNALALEHVTLTYPDGTGLVTALNDVTFTVDRGQFVALVGPSGSGKSSALAVAATLIRPQQGTVTIDGQNVTSLSDHARTTLRRNAIGIVFQEPNLLDSLTALEQLTVVATIAGTRARDAVDGAMDLLNAVGMSKWAGRRPAQLSGGQRQRVNIARALMGQPSVLLVDEPTSALDHEKGAEIMALLRQVTSDHDLAAVVVTHDTGHLAADDTVLTCQDGAIQRRSAASAPSLSAPRW